MVRLEGPQRKLRSISLLRQPQVCAHLRYVLEFLLVHEADLMADINTSSHTLPPSSNLLCALPSQPTPFLFGMSQHETAPLQSSRR